MKRYYRVQLVIDVVLILEGLLIYMFPEVSAFNANIVFYTMMAIYAGLELCEFLFIRDFKEPLYLFFVSAVCAFSGFFLKSYDASIVLSLTLVAWILMISIIKIASLENIYEKKSHLFTIKLGALSALILISLLVAINIYYRLSTLAYMLALLYLCYGFLEFGMDFLDYLSDDIEFLKE